MANAMRKPPISLGKPKKRPAGLSAHTIRAADGGFVTIPRYGRTLAVACFCTECLGFEDSPADCTAKLCPLYPFRAKTLRSKKGNRDEA